MQTAADKFLNYLIRKFITYKSGGVLYRLKNSGHSEKLLAEALGEALDEALSPEEITEIEKIEQLRKKLNSSREVISIEDYGAQSPDKILTEEEIQKGRVVKRAVGEVCRSSSKPYIWSLILFKIIRKFKPDGCIELGTCLGISGAYQSAALKLNGKGKLITLEGAESLALLSEQNFKSLGLNNVQVIRGKFIDTLGEVLKSNVPVDFAFIDGHHDGNATLQYFEMIKPHLSAGAVLVFDDIAWSISMQRAWRKISSDSLIKSTADLKQIGVCICR